MININIHIKKQHLIILFAFIGIFGLVLLGNALDISLPYHPLGQIDFSDGQANSDLNLGGNSLMNYANDFASTNWVDNNFYDTSESYSSSEIDNNFATTSYVDNNYATTSYVDNEISSISSGVSLGSEITVSFPEDPDSPKYNVWAECPEGYVMVGLKRDRWYDGAPPSAIKCAEMVS